MTQITPIAFEPTYRCLLPETDRLHLILIGCGGTGSHLAPTLGTLALSAKAKGKAVRITLIDGDTAEAKNVGRQRFTDADIGHNKAVVLSWRLNLAFGLETRAIPHFFTRERARRDWNLFAKAPPDSTILIGCVDNHLARREISSFLDGGPRQPFWIDCGNAYASGQVLIGNTGAALTCPNIDLGLISQLPSPGLQLPELLLEDEDKKKDEGKEKEKDKKKTENEETALSCADLLLRDEQSLVVNGLTAAIASQYLFQFVIQRELTSLATVFNGLAPIAQSKTLTHSNLDLYFEKQNTI